jgi:broad specificity phosphatase PhoE
MGSEPPAERLGIETTRGERRGAQPVEKREDVWRNSEDVWRQVVKPSAETLTAVAHGGMHSGEG